MNNKNANLNNVIVVMVAVMLLLTVVNYISIQSTNKNLLAVSENIESLVDTLPETLSEALAPIDEKLTIIETLVGAEPEEPEEHEEPEEPVEGKLLIVGATSYYGNTDIDIGYGGLDSIVERFRADKLLMTDPKIPGEYICQLAERWEYVEEGDEAFLDFYIRPNLVGHDGRAINAESVKWSYEREPLADSHHVWWHATSYQDLIVLDELKLRLVLPEEKFIPHTLATLMLLQHGFIKSTGATGAWGPAGTGPYILTEYTPGERLVYERWEDYPDIPGAVVHPGYADKIIVKLFADPSSLALAIRAGEIDIAWKDLTKQDLQIMSEDPDITVELTPTGYSRYLAFNRAVEPFDKLEVRQAIAYALDVEEILDMTQLGMAQLSLSPVHDWMPFYHTAFDDMYDQSSSNIEKAKELLVEAGYPNGFDCELWYADRFDSYVTEGLVATVIQSQLAEIGITVNPSQVEWGLYSAKVKAGAVPGMGLGGWKFDYPDPDSDLIYCMTYEDGSGRGFTEWGFKNLEADDLIKQGRILYDPNNPDDPERKAVYVRLQEIHAEQVTNVPLFFANEYEVYRKDVKGYHIFWTAYWRPIWNAYKEEWGITPDPDWDIFK